MAWPSSFVASGGVVSRHPFWRGRRRAATGATTAKSWRFNRMRWLDRALARGGRLLRVAFVAALLSLGVAAHEAAMAMALDAGAMAEAMPAGMTMTAGAPQMQHMSHDASCMAPHCAPAPACCVLEQCFIGVVPTPDIGFPTAGRPALVAAPAPLRTSSVASLPFRPPTLS